MSLGKQHSSSVLLRSAHNFSTTMSIKPNSVLGANSEQILVSPSSRVLQHWKKIIQAGLFYHDLKMGVWLLSLNPKVQCSIFHVSVNYEKFLTKQDWLFYLFIFYLLEILISPSFFILANLILENYSYKFRWSLCLTRLFKHFFATCIC